MEISITEEQAKVLQVAESSLVPVLLQTGGILPTISVHTGERVRYLAAEMLRQK